MAQYLYECDSCGALTEREFRMADRRKRVMCACGKMARRAIVSPNAIIRHRYIDNSPRKGRGNGNRSGYFGKGTS